MNAVIYADEYQRLEAHLDTIQNRHARRARQGQRHCTDTCGLDAERLDVIRRLMHLDDLIVFDHDLDS